jgi:uncharacterized membrane protein HdeD (DUF308 family)
VFGVVPLIAGFILLGHVMLATAVPGLLSGWLTLIGGVVAIAAALIGRVHVTGRHATAGGGPP